MWKLRTRESELCKATRWGSSRDKSVSVRDSILYLYSSAVGILKNLTFQDTHRRKKCNSFLLLLKQITTNLLTLTNNQKITSLSNKIYYLVVYRPEVWHGSHQTKIEVLAWLCSFLEAPRENLFSGLFQLQKLLAFLGSCPLLPSSKPEMWYHSV